MAFFGLTSLGPQNTFAATSTRFRQIIIFSDQDFTRAWNRVNGKDQMHCDTSKLKDIIKVLYCGPTPESDALVIDRVFEEAFDTISYDEYMAKLIKLREDCTAEEKELSKSVSQNCEYISSSEFHLSLRKNAAMSRELQTKQVVPLTASQEYGWQKQELKRPHAGKPGSDITKYAAELIKNGIYY